METKECHCLSVDHVTSGLGSHIEKGLTEAEVQKRIKEHGYNELTEKPRPGFLRYIPTERSPSPADLCSMGLRFPTCTGMPRAMWTRY
jgi:hypothetical protein